LPNNVRETAVCHATWFLFLPLRWRAHGAARYATVLFLCICFFTRFGSPKSFDNKRTGIVSAVPVAASRALRERA
jgi:hypothetical protein